MVCYNVWVSLTTHMAKPKPEKEIVEKIREAYTYGKIVEGTDGKPVFKLYRRPHEFYPPWYARMA